MGCAVTPIRNLTHRAGLANLASHEVGTPANATFRDRWVWLLCRPCVVFLPYYLLPVDTALSLWLSYRRLRAAGTL
jgi:hypothetical protein